MSKLVVREYAIVDETRPPDCDVRIEWRGENAWVVFWSDDVLNRDGDWEYEPLPSARTADFKSRTRWPTVTAAHQAYERFAADAV